MKEQSENHFIKNFTNKLNTVKNKEYLIENEINQILAFTSSPDKDPNFLGDLNFANETKSVFNLMEMGNPVYFNSVFNEYLIEEKVTPILEFNEEGEMLPVEDDFFKEEREDAIAFVKYYLWLKALQNPEKAKSKEKAKATLTHKQKMIALHYLGLNTSKYDNVKTAKILSQILDVGEENTRKYLSYLSAGKNNVRTSPNLEKVSQLFENAGITEVSTKINLDIEKIK